MNLPLPRSNFTVEPTFTRRTLGKQRTRQRLLGAARRLFAERGYEAATIRDIAAAADLSTGAVFASFTDKAELFNEVIFQGYELLSRKLREADPEATCQAALIKLFTIAYTLHRDELQLMQAAIGFSWLRDGASEQRARAGKAVVQDQIDDMLRRGVENGELSRKINIRLIGDMIWAAYISNYREAIYDGWTTDALGEKISAQIDILLAGARIAPEAASGAVAI